MISIQIFPSPRLVALLSNYLSVSFFELQGSMHKSARQYHDVFQV